MKIFVQCIFKCKRCPFNTKTTLKANKTQHVESNHKLEILRNFIESSEGIEFLKNLQLEFNFLTEEDILNPFRSENLRKVLFETEIVDGYLKCDNCKLIYPINDFILDTVDCIEQK